MRSQMMAPPPQLPQIANVDVLNGVELSEASRLMKKAMMTTCKRKRTREASGSKRATAQQRTTAQGSNVRSKQPKASDGRKDTRSVQHWNF